MANVIDETNKEVYETIFHKGPDKLLRLLKAINKILDEHERKQEKEKQKAEYEEYKKNRTNYKELKETYQEKLQEIEKMTKELNEKYKALYNEARESGDYKNILPETYQAIKESIKQNKNGFEIGDLNKYAEIKPFMNEYINEYEDITLEDYTDKETGNLYFGSIMNQTDFEKEVLNEIVDKARGEIIGERVQKQNEYENLIDSIFENEKLTVPTGSNEITDIIQGDER